MTNFAKIKIAEMQALIDQAAASGERTCTMEQIGQKARAKLPTKNRQSREISQS
ncbi:MAG: hypothetical protein LC637_13855 [Xanthomonadaceae bacterium]|nr:hypothetical protein [Xanthomonadaceae bacterium]